MTTSPKAVKLPWKPVAITPESTKSWEEFWAEGEAGGFAAARPMCDALVSAFGCYLTSARVDANKAEEANMHIDWDDGTHFLWLTQRVDGLWEWFFRDRSTEKYEGSGDDEFISSTEEMLKVVEPFAHWYKT